MTSRSRASEAYEVTLENWQTFAASKGLVHFEKDKGGNVGLVVDNPLYDRGVDAIKEKRLSWHDFVVGCTHVDEDGKLYITQCKGIGDKTAEELYELWASPEAFEQFAIDQRAREERRRKAQAEALAKELKTLEAA